MNGLTSDAGLVTSLAEALVADVAGKLEPAAATVVPRAVAAAPSA